MPESADAREGKSWEIWTVIGPLGGPFSLENLPLPEWLFGGPEGSAPASAWPAAVLGVYC